MTILIHTYSHQKVATKKRKIRKEVSFEFSRKKCPQIFERKTLNFRAKNSNCNATLKLPEIAKNHENCTGAKFNEITCEVSTKRSSNGFP